MSSSRTTVRTVALTAAAGVALTVPVVGGLLTAGNAATTPARLSPANAAPTVAAAAAAAPAAVPAQVAALAGTVVTSVDNGGGLSVRAAAGKANVINVTLSNITFTVRDTGDVVTPGAGCTAVDTNTVRCTAFGQRINIDSGDLNDTVVALTPLPTSVQAGAGDDTVTTGTAADTLRGSAGNDKLNGGAGADTLDGNVGVDVVSGQEGRDTLQGGGRKDEADVYSGGADTDTVDYSGRDTALNISLNDVANDGEAGELDNVRSDVEDIEAGAGNDVLTGSNIATVTNRLVGGEGGDTLIGLAGKDRMFAQEGNDTLDGGAGDDDMDGGPNADTFIGGPDRDEVLYQSRTNNVFVDLDDVDDDGEINERDNVRSDIEDISTGSGNDRLTGSSAANRFSAGSGDDTMDGGVGPDFFSGEAGFDRVTYETRDATIIANIDSLDNDGVTGEKDTIPFDIEGIIGGKNRDLLGGSDNDDNLVGGPGDDVLLGFDGNDQLFGNDGSDSLGCAFGTDLGNGGAGTDSSNLCETNISVENPS